MPEAAKPFSKRPKMTVETQMAATMWLVNNRQMVSEMTLNEVVAAINGQCGANQTVPESSVQRLLKAAGFSCKPATAGEARQKLKGLYDKMLVLQGRIEQQDETINTQQAQINTLLRRVDLLVENSNWTTTAVE